MCEQQIGEDQKRRFEGLVLRSVCSMATSLNVGEGTVIAQRYRLLEPLGKGAMGEVWKAEHLSLHSVFAVKLIDPALLAESASTKQELLARFQREAQASAQLQSPHVVQVTDHGLDNGVPYMVMELLNGENLGDRLERVGQLSPQTTLRIMSHIARAMSKAHEAGIIHRDLKPDNVFIVANEDEETAKVLDFGIAKLTRSPLDLGLKATTTGQLLGTPCYMSPEQATGADLDHRSDLWAMAVITYECLTGTLPFLSTNLGELILAICSRPLPVPTKVAPWLPAEFDAWWLRAASRDVNGRFSSAREFLSGLRTALGLNDVRLSAPQAPDSSGGAAALPQPDSAVAVASTVRTSLPNSPTRPEATVGLGTISPITTSRTRAARKTKRSVALFVGIGLGGALALGAAVLIPRLGQPTAGASPATEVLEPTEPTITPTTERGAPPEVVPNPTTPAVVPSATASVTPSALASSPTLASGTAPTARPVITKPAGPSVVSTASKPLNPVTDPRLGL